LLFEQKHGRTNVTSLVERVSRITVILKDPNKRTKPVMGKIIKVIGDRLNNTPRKCLGLKTPAEAFKENVLKEMARGPCPQKQQES